VVVGVVAGVVTLGAAGVGETVGLEVELPQATANKHNEHATTQIRILAITLIELVEQPHEPEF